MKMKISIIVSAIVITVITGVAVYINAGLHSTRDTMEFIASRKRPDGSFLDYDHSIDVYSADDLGWYKDGDNWYVLYGKLQLEFTPEQLADESFMKLVNSIDLDVKGNIEEGTLRFYWRGEKLDECVPQ